MRGLKLVTSLIAVSLMCTSCLSLNGHLEVRQVMAAKKKSGILNLGTKEIQIQPDSYMAELKINSDKNFTLKLEGHDTILIPIKGNKDLNIPSSGRVSLNHDMINQPFDLEGEIVTTVTHSPRQDIIEECSRTVTENHCQKICEQSDSCTIVCKDELVTIKGLHEVSYHFRTTQRDLSVDFLKAGKPEVLASFHGSDTDTDQITDYSGICR